jgi:PPOX class probable F420-dependent enzyme
MATSTVPERFNDLLGREKRPLAHLAVVRRDGTPHITPMWFDYDGTHFIFNTARGRVKDRNLSKPNAIVALSIVDPENDGRGIQVVGRVVSETEEGAYEQICALAEKYRRPTYPKIPGQVRVTYKVLPERVTFLEFVFKEENPQWPDKYLAAGKKPDGG